METSLRNKVSTIIYYFSLMTFIIGFSFSDNPVGNWYQQFMPNLNGRLISDITFVDSLTGYAVTSTPADSAYILKTSNGGDNWSINYTATNFIFNRIQFLNQNTGYAGGTNLLKTINAASNWTTINSFLFFQDFYFISNDTGWYVDPNSLVGGVFRTTNGGVTWQNQLVVPGQNPNHVYFFNRNIGFISRDNNYIRKTMDSGQNWTVISSSEGFSNIHFVDSLTGWKFYIQMEKTTDGGSTWVLQPRPSGGNLFTLGIPDFSVIGRDTLWSPSGYILYPNNQTRGVLFRSTTGGNSWEYQIPDTSINISYHYIEFTNRLHGWVYGYGTGIHTTTGGDPVWYTGVQQISNEIPKEFILFQNYPNPFNSKANIKYQISKSGFVSLKVFDITGRFASTLVEQKQSPGLYQVDFEGNELSSGVYFYSLLVDGALIDTKKMILLK